MGRGGTIQGPVYVGSSYEATYGEKPHKCTVSEPHDSTIYKPCGGVVRERGHHSRPSI